MIDTAITLAISVRSSAGVYALLLGSGVSRSSGVPTGWEIVEHLIRKLSLLKGGACDADPRAWYRNTFGREPDYSELLNEVAKSPAERMQVLRDYFEPTEEERLQGLKLPTPAHRSIATLVAKKYIRVLITTNFDRLLESALVDIGIQPVVISTGDAARGALPLAHSPCTIIKVNGDYLDTRLKNTGEELSSYEDGIEHLLNQVFDEYGLIVCGWSGEWDIALRRALERSAARRFTTYWTGKSDLGLQARNLVALRQAVVLNIGGADQFFKDLLDNISALENMMLTDVISTKVAVARMKRYLSDSTQRINLYDLLTAETEKAHAVLTGPQFAIMNLSFEDMRRRVSAYEGALETLLHLMICGTFWGAAEHDALLLRCYKRIADQQVSLSPPTPELARYPGLFLLHGIGLAACAAQNYRFLRSLLSLRVRSVAYKENTVASVVYDEYVLDKYSQAQTFEGKYMCEYMFGALREPLREYVPSDYDYDKTFDWFEYLACLCHCDALVTRSDIEDKKAKDPKFILMASIGRFGLNDRFAGRNGIQAETELRAGEPYPEKVAAVLQAGFFDSGGRMQEDKFRDVKAAFDRFVSEYRQGLHPTL